MLKPFVFILKDLGYVGEVPRMKMLGQVGLYDTDG